MVVNSTATSVFFKMMLKPFRILRGHFVKFKTKFGKERIDSAFKVVRSAFALDEDHVSNRRCRRPGSTEDDVAKLFFRAQLVKGRFARHLAK